MFSVLEIERELVLLRLDTKNLEKPCIILMVWCWLYIVCECWLKSEPIKDGEI